MKFKIVLAIVLLFLLENNGQKIISRNDWSSANSSRTIRKLLLPVHKIIIGQTATRGCTTTDNCKEMVKAIQRMHMKNFDDIGYNFLIGGNGEIYEGRGWNLEGAHTKSQNVLSLGIAFIGKFDRDPAPAEQINAALALIAEGVKLNKISSDYKVFGHRQFVDQSPGDALFDIIQKWPQWQKSIWE